jgi:cytochrome c556
MRVASTLGCGQAPGKCALDDASSCRWLLHEAPRLLARRGKRIDRAERAEKLNKGEQAMTAMRVARAGMLATFVALVAPAVGANQGVIDYRQSVYDAIGGHMTAMADIIKQKVDRTDDLAIHAEAMGRLAELPRDLFPPDSRDGKTDALPAIWENPEEFEQRVDDFEQAAGRVAETVDGDYATFVDAFKSLGQTCKACHDDFRAED